MGNLAFNAAYHIKKDAKNGNADSSLFTCAANTDHILMLSSYVYADLNEFKAILVDPLNKQFGANSF